MRRIAIEISEDRIEVLNEYGETTGQLTLGEMLEQIIAIAQRAPRPYPMLTTERWAECLERVRADRASILDLPMGGL